MSRILVSSPVTLITVKASPVFLLFFSCLSGGGNQEVASLQSSDAARTSQLRKSSLTKRSRALVPVAPAFPGDTEPVT